MHDNHSTNPPRTPEQGYHLTEDLTNRALQFVKEAKTIAPEKPFFLYYAPGACHAPHHAPKDWIARFKGRFDMGYEAIRTSILARQKELGIVPADTQLPPINPIGTSQTRKGPEGQPFPELDYTRPWESLADGEKKLFARMAEVYAGFLAHADHHIGRLLDYLEESEQLDNTLIVLVSDNGASGEGGPNGSVNEMKFFNGIPDDINQNLAMLDELGGPKTYNHYPTGWAMAFNTPFKMWKRYEFNGGTSDPCMFSWPRGIRSRGEIRLQYHHAIDVVPTILECLQVEQPATIDGYVQSDFDGMSMRYSFDDAAAKTTRPKQFYSMLGSRAVWQDGWKAVTDHPTLSGWGHYQQDNWELYNVETDRAELHNLSAQEPDRLRQLIHLWYAEAGANMAFPLDDRSAIEIITTPRPVLTRPRNRYIYYPDVAELPEQQAVNIRNRSFVIGAQVDISDSNPEGVIFAHGSRFGGHSLYLKDGRLHYVYNFVGIAEQRVTATEKVATGPNLIISASFEKDSEEPRGVANGTLSLYYGDLKVGEGRIRTQPGNFSLVGEGLTIGRSSGEPVTDDYPGESPWSFHGGTIKRVAVDVSGEPYADLERQAAAMLARE
jgi:arylsulfatase